jgi:hypothetical protein
LIRTAFFHARTGSILTSFGRAVSIARRHGHVLPRARLATLQQGPVPIARQEKHLRRSFPDLTLRAQGATLELQKHRVQQSEPINAKKLPSVYAASMTKSGAV